MEINLISRTDQPITRQTNHPPPQIKNPRTMPIEHPVTLDQPRHPPPHSPSTLALPSFNNQTHESTMQKPALSHPRILLFILVAHSSSSSSSSQGSKSVMPCRGWVCSVVVRSSLLCDPCANRERQQQQPRQQSSLRSMDFGVAHRQTHARGERVTQRWQQVALGCDC